MKDFIHNIANKYKLYIYISVVVLFFISLFVSLVLYINYIQKLYSYQNSVKELKISFIELENIKQKTEEEIVDNMFFLENTESKYYTSYKDKNAFLNVEIDKLSENNLTEKLLLTKLYNELSDEFLRNTTISDKYFKLVYDKGDENTGSFGQLSSTIEILKNKIKGHEMENKVVLLIELMQNYIVTNNNQYLNRFNELYAEIALNMNFDAGVFTILAADSVSNQFELSNTSTIRDSLVVEEIEIMEDSVSIEMNDIQNNSKDKNNFVGISGKKDIYIIRQLNNLKNQFADLVALNYEIGLTSNEGLKSSIRRSYNRINILITDIEKVAIQNNKILIRRSMMVITIEFIIFVLLYVFSTIAIFKIIRVKISDIGNLLSTLAAGKIPALLDVEFNQNDLTSQLLDNSNKVIAGLRSKLFFVKEIIENKDVTDFKPLSSFDDLGNSLIELRENLRKTKEAEDKLKKEEAERNWITIGITRFADILRQSTNNLNELGYSIVFELVKYMNINQGGIFHLNDDDKSDTHISMLASYAYDRRKFKKKRIEINEGLIGTCIREKKITHLQNVPSDYISVTSGLGMATPQNLLLVPLLFEGNIYGAIELASFNAFKPFEIEFVEKVSENIATTLSTMKINIRTAELLEQSKIQSEAMQAQEEELRQNLEELLATNEEIERKEAEHTNFREALNKSVFIVQVDLNGYIYHVNSMVTDFYGLDNHSFEEHYIESLENFELITMYDIEKVRDVISEGGTFKQIVTKTLNGTDYRLLEVYTAINNYDEIAGRILFTAIDVTALR